MMESIRATLTGFTTCSSKPASRDFVTSSGCPYPQECVCTDGQTLTSGTVCSAGSCTGGFSESSCASACKSNGGVSLIRPARNVATSAECDAWCSKGALGCGSTKCNLFFFFFFFFCGVSQGSCEAATRAALKCAVDEATWACSTHSTSWSVTSSCGTFASLCDVASAPSR